MRFKTSVTFLICLAFVVLLSRYSYAEDDLVIKTGFDTFSDQWLQLFAEKGCSSRKTPCIMQDQTKPGVVIAQYQEFIKVVNKEVKSTGNPVTPYVGILKYEVFIYESEGSSADEAKKGPFYKTKQVTMTEIFRYSKGKWVSD
ncbi:MAG: hypothetical protein WHS38_03410 [Thermodesulforhabdaceae bacterium]